MDPTLRRFPLRRLRVPLGTGCLSLVVPDWDAWIRQGDWAEATVRGAEPPYWVQIWPASVAMARLVWRRGPLTGLRVLDLGCGLGLPGIAAGQADAEVTFADREPDALAFARWNAVRPGGAVAPVARQLDWSQGHLEGMFDVILLADVSYRPLHHPALRRHVQSCLAAGGVVLHADPMRRESEAFVQWLREQFTVIETRRRTSFLERRLEVRLCVASREESALQVWREAMGEVPPS